MNFLKGIIFFATSFLLVQCNKSAGADEIVHHPSISKEKIQPIKKDSPIQKEITYFPFVLKNKESAFAALDKKYSKEEIHTILALNRLDFKNRRRADTLVIPNVLEKDFNVYSPFPKTVTLAKDIHKLALFCYPIHAYALYEKGKLVKWGPTSMGKEKTPTKIGLGFTNWKKKIAISTSNSEWKLR